MTLIEIGALASAGLAIISLTGKIVKLITTIQTLIQSIDDLQVDMVENTDHWESTNTKYYNLDQRLSVIEYELALI